PLASFLPCASPLRGGGHRVSELSGRRPPSLSLPYFSSLVDFHSIACHRERSEGPAGRGEQKVLRFAQDDNTKTHKFLTFRAELLILVRQSRCRRRRLLKPARNHILCLDTRLPFRLCGFVPPGTRGHKWDTFREWASPPK